jgi:predicted RNA-binding Zn ribbon-like protein
MATIGTFTSVVEATLALVARDALDLVSSADLARVRPCSNPECQVLFLDSSRPGRRRWCSMGTCGNRAKKAAQSRAGLSSQNERP